MTMQGYAVRKWVALVGLAAVHGCGSPTAPTPDFVGNYTLVVEASPVCELPVERYTWDLIATSSGGSGAGGRRYLLVLPGGNTSVTVNLTYANVQSGRGRGSSSRVAFTTDVSFDAPVATDFRARFNGSSRGTASVAPDGRGEVLDGTLGGTLEVTDGTQRPPQIGRCTAADHRWILTPR